jgi:hypothetical protein
MKPIVAVVADCANVESHGKLNIMGIFDVINAAQIPVVHPSMQLVVRFVADPSETNVALPVEVQLVDEDGGVVFGIKGQVTFHGGDSGEPTTTNHIVGLNNLRFEKFGDYEFKILVRDEPVVTIPLKVQPIPSPKPLAA